MFFLGKPLVFCCVYLYIVYHIRDLLFHVLFVAFSRFFFKLVWLLPWPGHP